MPSEGRTILTLLTGQPMGLRGSALEQFIEIWIDHWGASSRSCSLMPLPPRVWPLGSGGLGQGAGPAWCGKELTAHSEFRGVCADRWKATATRAALVCDSRGASRPGHAGGQVSRNLGRRPVPTTQVSVLLWGACSLQVRGGCCPGGGGSTHLWSMTWVGLGTRRWLCGGSRKCALAEWETQVQSWSKTRPESEQRLYFGSRILLVVLADGEKEQRCSHFRIKKPTACVLCTGQAQGPGGSSQRREQRSLGQRCLRRVRGPQQVRSPHLCMLAWAESTGREPSKALRKARRQPPHPSLAFKGRHRPRPK